MGNLKWLHNLRNPTRRLARWSLELLEYDFEIIHRKGALHHVLNALSRITEDEEITISSVCESSDSLYKRRVAAVLERPWIFPDWKVEDQRLYRHRPNGMTDPLIPDLEAWKLVVPEEQRIVVLIEAHSEPQAGHLGVKKTYHRLSLRYYWPGIYADVAKFVKQCDPCQRSKVEQDRPASLMGQRIVEQPWTVVFQDLFTKWVEVVPIRTVKGPRIKQQFEDLVVSRWGALEVVHTDNGTEFSIRLIEQTCKGLGIVLTTNSVYHAQANPTERVNRVLETMIVAFLRDDHRDWDLHLHEFRFAYNTAVHGSLRVTLAFLNFGREPLPCRSLRNEVNVKHQRCVPEPSERLERMERLSHLRNLITRNLDRAYETQAKYYDKIRRERHFKVCNLVLKRERVLSNKEEDTAAKLSDKFSGPYKVVRRLSPVVFRLVDSRGKHSGKEHVRHLKPYVASDDQSVGEYSGK